MATLESAGVAIVVDRRSGSVSTLRLGRGREQMTDRTPAAFLEVADLRTGKTYCPLRAESTLSSWRAAHQGVRFLQRYQGAPFTVAQSFRATPAGIRWECSLKLLKGQKQNRSLRVTWVLPAPIGWRFWAPQDTQVLVNDGVTPRRYLYGHTSFRPYGTMIPLVGTWSERAGLAAFSPPDVQKPFISFDLHTQESPMVRGPDPGPQDLPQLRIAYHLVGLRPGRELVLAVCLAGVQPDWRCVLGHYVESYPELFEPIPATRKVEGMYSITTPTRLAQGQLARMKRAGVTFAEVHGHFPEYSVYVTREALKRPQLTWRCRPHPGKQLCLADNRQWIRKLNKAGIAPFMYWYNCHANPRTIRKLWPRELMRDERGRVLIKYHTEPALHGTPDSPYGRHLIEQMELMIQAYPEAPGFFVDNYAVEMLDFDHDDGVTMVHDRPAYDLNQNHIVLGPVCFEKAHRAGKIIMVNKISTIESLRGADMVLAETRGVASLRKHALACVFRPLFPLGMELPPGPHGPERGMQHLLLLGCTPDDKLYRDGPAAMRAYRPLTDAMIGKRWVLERDPLGISWPPAGRRAPADLPEGLAGQIFRIDRCAPRGGSVVVALVDLNRSYRERRFSKGISVTVRLREAGKLRKADWLSAERSSHRPVPCKIARKGRAVTVALPPVGAAGILRLSP